MAYAAAARIPRIASSSCCRRRQASQLCGTIQGCRAGAHKRCAAQTAGHVLQEACASNAAAQHAELKCMERAVCSRRHASSCGEKLSNIYTTQHLSIPPQPAAQTFDAAPAGYKQQSTIHHMRFAAAGRIVRHTVLMAGHSSTPFHSCTTITAAHPPTSQAVQAYLTAQQHQQVCCAQLPAYLLPLYSRAVCSRSHASSQQPHPAAQSCDAALLRLL